MVKIHGSLTNKHISPGFFSDKFTFDSTVQTGGYIRDVQRKKESNYFFFTFNGKSEKTFYTPFITNNGLTNYQVLQQSLGKNIDVYRGIFEKGNYTKNYSVKSIFKDSLFRTMMHRSDNFFAEQTLLMASNELLGYMNDKSIIDTLFKKELKDIPQIPSWVDGSGLSRYNLFTPMDFVFILEKLKNEFGLDRIKNLLPSGGTGTLENYYRSDIPFIYAKTGTLSNHCALSGYLITRKNKLLEFSILANHYNSAATPIRKAIELFLREIRDKY